ncbi:1,4-alpha-glucan branching enzyme, partial [Priestia megaterium]|uniref:alpha amylase C-terminal domain-containing protein n=1 Tax=Priestia megaterium TaxID=1404 RepID=UPI000C037F5D
ALDDPAHAGVLRALRDLNAVYRENPALWQLDPSHEGFEWIDSDDAARNTLAYLRKGPGAPDVAVVVNFAGIPHEGYRLALPAGGEWTEIYNSDAVEYGGSGVGNDGAVQAKPEPHY